MQREVIKWLQSLDLTYPVVNPRRDLSNGFAAAEILSRYVDDSIISMRAISNGSSPDTRRSNWDQVFKALQRLGCRSITQSTIENVIQMNPNASLYILDNLYELLTNKVLAVRSIDTGHSGKIFNDRDCTKVVTLLEVVGEVPVGAIPANVPSGLDADQEQAHRRYAMECLQDKLAKGRNVELSSGLSSLKKPRYTHPTCSTLVHNANHSRYSVTLKGDRYLPDELSTQKQNEQLLDQHKRIKEVLKEAKKKNDSDAPLTTIIRGRYANSKIYERKKDFRRRASRTDSTNLFQPDDLVIGTRKVEVNVLSATLMEALENNGIYTARDQRADEKSIEFFSSCNFSVRKAFSLLLRDILAAHKELFALLERGGKICEGDVMEDLFTALVSQRDKIPIETLQACWTSLEQNTAGIAAAVNEKQEEYGYIIQTLSYLFTLESSQMQVLHVSGANTAEKLIENTGNEEFAAAPLPRTTRSQSFGHALLGTQGSYDFSRTAKRGVIRNDRQAFHVASGFTLLGKIGEALHQRNSYTAEAVVTDYLLPAVLPSLLYYGRAGMMDAVSRVLVTLFLGKLEGNSTPDEDYEILQPRLEKLVKFMTNVVQPMMMQSGQGQNGGSIVSYSPTTVNRSVQRFFNRQRYYYFLYHVMRQIAEKYMVSVEPSINSQSVYSQHPLVELAYESASQCLTSEHEPTRALGVAITLMLLLWDCWFPCAALVKEFIVLPATRCSDCVSPSVFTSAGRWEGHILTLDLLCLLTKKLVILLEEGKDSPAEIEGFSSEEAHALSLRIMEVLPFEALDAAATVYLKAFLHRTQAHRQLALSIVGQHLLPDGLPQLANLWVQTVASFPISLLQSMLLGELSSEEGEIFFNTEENRAKCGLPSTLNNSLLESSGPSESISSTRLLLGEVEPTYSVLPLNQIWDTYNVVHVLLRHWKDLDPLSVLIIIAAALMSPQEEITQVSQLIRSFNFSSPQKKAFSTLASLSSKDLANEMSEESLRTMTLREIVLASTSRRGEDLYGDKEAYHESGEDEQRTEERDEEYFEEDEEMEEESLQKRQRQSSKQSGELDGFRISRAFWYYTLEILNPLIKSFLPCFSNRSTSFDEMKLSEQLSCAVLLTLYNRYAKESKEPIFAFKAEDAEEAADWLSSHFSTE